MATIFMKEAKKAVDAGSERKDQGRNFVKVAYSTSSQSTSSSDRPATDISGELTNKKTYFKKSKEQAPDLAPSIDGTAGSKSKRCKK